MLLHEQPLWMQEKPGEGLMSTFISATHNVAWHDDLHRAWWSMRLVRGHSLLRVLRRSHWIINLQWSSHILLSEAVPLPHSHYKGFQTYIALAKAWRGIDTATTVNCRWSIRHWHNRQLRYHIESGQINQWDTSPDILTLIWRLDWMTLLTQRLVLEIKCAGFLLSVTWVRKPGLLLNEELSADWHLQYTVR